MIGTTVCVLANFGSQVCGGGSISGTLKAQVGMLGLPKRMGPCPMTPRPNPKP